MQITLTNIPLQETPSGNQTINLWWKFDNQPDSTYQALPNATVDPTGTIIFPVPYVFTTGGVNTEDIRVRAINSCNSGYVITALFQGFNPPIWVEDTYTCEQDNPFTLQNNYNGFSSPFNLMWDAPTQRYYVMDADNVNGNIWWFDPTVMTGPGNQNFVPGSQVGGQVVQSLSYSQSLRKLFLAGPNTNGAVIYDIANNTFATVGGGTNGAFARVICRLLGNTLYLGNQFDATLTLINATTDALISVIPVNSIPGNTSNQYFNGVYLMHSVNGEIWVCAATARQQNGNIARYDATLSNFLGEITIPGVTPNAAWGGGYWQFQFYDAAMGRFYLHDSGSNTTTVINATTASVVDQMTLTDMGGKAASQITWELNEVSGEMYANRRNMNTPGDNTAIVRFYVVNRTTYQFEAMYANQEVASLSWRQGTNEFWACIANRVIWDNPNTGWDTDGQLFRYTS